MIKLLFRNMQDFFIFICRFSLVKMLNKNFCYNKRDYYNLYKICNKRFIFSKNL